MQRKPVGPSRHSENDLDIVMISRMSHGLTSGSALHHET